MDVDSWQVLHPRKGQAMTKTLATRIDNLERHRRGAAQKKPPQVWVHCPGVDGEPEHWASLDGRQTYTRADYETVRADPAADLWIVHWERLDDVPTRYIM
jgi:hypothetical protein